MPRQHEKRGKRKARQRGDPQDHGSDRSQWNESGAQGTQYPEERPTKRARSAEWQEPEDARMDATYDRYDHQNYQQAEEDAPAGGHDEFFGLLSEDDQGYFKRIEAIFELDQFESAEEKALFIESVWRESDGKELKLACSQSCSRILERLIRASPPKYQKRLFQKFNSHFLFLVQHRFASHCCETLFRTAAPFVTEELVAPTDAATVEAPEEDEVYVSMENLFLFTVNELLENMGFLTMDVFASHSLRVLLTVMSGKPLDEERETTTKGTTSQDPRSAPGKRSSNEQAQRWRTVPSSFRDAVKKAITAIVGDLDTHYLRTLASNTLASKMLQLLLELEFSQPGASSKSADANGLYVRLIPDDHPTEETGSGQFLKGLLYDQAGSHLLEVIVQRTPGKLFKRLYRSFFALQVATMAKNETASFVLVRVLERLSAEDLRQTLDTLAPELPLLLSRQRYAVMRTLIERARIRSLDIAPVAAALEEHFGAPGPEATLALLQPDLASAPADESSRESRNGPSNTNASQHHARLLACSILGAADAAQAYLLACLAATPTPTLLPLALDRHATFVLQTALTHASTPTPTRRVLIQKLGPHAPQLAVDFIGAHVMSALWAATDGPLFFLKERTIKHLADDEDAVRSTPPGRNVWRSWRVEVWRREKREWVLKARELERDRLAANPPVSTADDPVQPARGRDESNLATAHESEGAPNKAHGHGNAKTPIELARERWLAKNQGKAGAGKGKGRGQDARVVRVR